MDFIFTNLAKEQFFQLPKSAQLMIRKKIEKIKQGGGAHFKPLIDMHPATHRLRVEDWRLVLMQCDEGFEVLKIGHRSTIYSS